VQILFFWFGARQVGVLLACLLKLGEGFLQVLGVLGKLLDALCNAGAVVVIGDCRFRSAWLWVSLLTAIKACFILPIFLIKSYSTSAFAASATSITLLSEWRVVIFHIFYAWSWHIWTPDNNFQVLMILVMAIPCVGFVMLRILTLNLLQSISYSIKLLADCHILHYLCT
jgi:hypothetical protein